MKNTEPAKGGRSMTRATLIALLAALTLAGTAHANPLHRGSKGKAVCALQWLESGHKPSAYTWLRPYKLPTPQPRGAGCQYGKRMIAATREAKRQLGFRLYWNGTAGKDFLEILQGKRARPLGYIARAARVRAADLEVQRKRTAARMTYGARIIAIEQTQLGVYETSTNWSTSIRSYLLASGLHYPAPWCAAFQQWAYQRSGLGRFANGSAGVFYIRDYLRSRGWLRSYPRPGWLVMFLDFGGHIGLVERTTASGFWSVEGNAANAVRRRWHPYSNHRPKIYGAIPGVDDAVRP